MEKTSNKIQIVISMIIAAILIFFGMNASKCHGDACDTPESNTANVFGPSIAGEYQIFPKMIPGIINEQVGNNEIILLDVRENSEWDAGHIAGAKHIALSNINYETTKELPKNLPIYIYCRSGKRAEEAELKLRSLGFEKAENIGGITYWQERGGNLVK